jgi:hypothetical protein
MNVINANIDNIIEDIPPANQSNQSVILIAWVIKSVAKKLIGRNRNPIEIFHIPGHNNNRSTCNL